MLRNKADLVFNIMLAAFFLIMLMVALSYGEEARMVPLVVLIPGLLLAVYRIGINIKKNGEKDTNDNYTASEAQVNRKFFVMVLWVFVLILLIWLLGFYLGTAVYIFLFLIAHQEKLLLSASIAIGTFAGFYIIFNILSKVVLYKGQLYIVLAKQGVYLPF